MTEHEDSVDGIPRRRLSVMDSIRLARMDWREEQEFPTQLQIYDALIELASRIEELERKIGKD